MRIQLIAKRETMMTGTSRYASDLFQGCKAMGVDTWLTYPSRQRTSPLVQNCFKYLHMDPQSFFASYPLRINLDNADLYHITSQMLATLLLFQRFPKPTLVTVLDIIPYLVRHMPKLNTFRHTADYLFYWLALAGLRRACSLIAISNYTKQTLVDKLKLDAERIYVIYPGVDHDKFKPLPVPESFCSKYGLDQGQRYILFVGSEDPRKNLPTLIQAFALVKQQMPGVKLLKVGPAHFANERQNLQSLVTELDLRKEIVFFDYIPDEDLPLFYNSAEILVMPSLYEGFGLPVVEAMACGTPVVCSQAGSLPEIMGQAGTCVDPTDHRKMADALLNLLDNPKERLFRKQAGQQQAARFTLEQTACATREVYTKMLSQDI